MAGSADDVIAFAKANCPDCCSYNFESGQVDRPSAGLHGQHRAVDFGTAECGRDGADRIYNLFLPLAQGPDYTVEELFNDHLPGWSHGAPSNFVEGQAHTHVGIRAGATLGAGGAARTATQVSLNPLDLLGDAEKALANVILDALGKLPRALLETLFGDHSPIEFSMRVLEVLAGALLAGTGAVMVVKLVTKDVPQSAIRKATRGPRKQVKRAQRELGKRARAGEVEAEGAKVRARRAITPGEPSPNSGAAVRASETVAGGKAQGAKLRKMVARAI